MKFSVKRWLLLLLSVVLSFAFAACKPSNNKVNDTLKSTKIDEKGSYDDFQSVADYIREYNKLPSNYITKSEATKLGWNPGDDLWKIAKGKSIGGDMFGNFEGSLPKAKGRTWRECDINYKGGKRGAHRILYSNDGLVYGTSDHYKTFKAYYDKPNK